MKHPVVLAQRALPEVDGHVAQRERPEVVARAFLGMLEQIAARRVA